MASTTYRVRLPGGHAIQLHDAETAEAYARSGATVTATTEAL